MAKPRKPKKTTAEEKTASPAVPVIATVMDDNALKDIKKLAEDLANQGMKVDQVMPLSGSIAGSCSPEESPALNRKMGGVVVVEQSVDAHQS